MSQLIIENLVKNYGQKPVVNQLNITVESGEMLSLLGPSGCGKTTTLRMIAGMHDPTSGSIRLDGKELTRIAPHKRNIGLVFQNYALFPHLNVFENVAFGLKRHGVPKSEIRERVEAALHSVRLNEFAERFPAQMSGGQQQRVALARTLVLKPPLVLFDEPLSNLDAKLRQALGIEIRVLQRKFGFTGIFVTHDQEEAMVISDRIAVMNGGNIVQIGTPQQIYMHPVDPFVADFVGESNLYPITNVTASEGFWRFELSKGNIISAEKTGNGSAPTYVMVRPEAVSVRRKGVDDQPVPEAGFNAVAGEVTFINYSGSSYLIGVAIESLDEQFIVRLQNTRKELDLRVGEEAVVQWPVHDTLTF
ncbi:MULTISPECIES: ABC transporter ATP-binding protein [unclassified Paenibacillus]|uniref:ABC transporter ATP-binding protein n=1 Tax=unclassified Paenibacillus TaxID=185978 RepID=UPI0024077344|nr:MULTISPECIES: ABC transporter ATP-binding protein [unclassified Paenibacillus]MDF9844502.1 spermidine/putrescine ABC transporter ATP-binding subunit [Paenibacillus sp. PastF-2]MDF9851106.1 spermidine/putrescine ABC transporter ATP-binding subunit [Paenibacillus sp. PastM-2]MDF9857678.1 spermidine/putrescine ABC transporter ATP-binding subunit [Paenibacillus sp. PastF-1]MDH6482944.1 spermidine/putrescine ABC transporter ATP-binding subunit [Paenibacillus sp. PastH-2]MDH6510369.1 spermidine/p